MSDLVEINVGDGVVDYDQHAYLGVDVRVVTGVTPKKYTYLDKWIGERRRDRSFVVYAGPADTAARLAEQIKSSLAQRNHARRQAGEQHTERVAKFIAEAKVVSP